MERTGQQHRGCLRSGAIGCPVSGMSLEQTLNDEERLADLDLGQLQQLVGLVEYDAVRRSVPGVGLGRARLGRRQRHADGALLPVRVRHGAGRLLRPGDRQPRPPRVRAAVGGGPVRRHRRRTTRPARSPTTTARTATGSSTSPSRCPTWTAASPTPGAGRDGPRASRTTSPTSTARCGWPPSPPTATPGTRWSTGPATPARTCPATSRGRRPPSSAPARPSGSSRRSTTSSATSSSARWTSGSTSTTASWASPTWPSSSATTSPPTTPR